MFISVFCVQICVWCWHHIMDMAEKDESEGRCPACRTAYDKDRIVGMAASCERLFFNMYILLGHKYEQLHLRILCLAFSLNPKRGKKSMSLFSLFHVFFHVFSDQVGCRS